MKTIEVCLTPELLHLYDVSKKAVVVVDILRATSCMVTALANGADHIVPVASLDVCQKMKADGYITSGERDGVKLEGFDKGNSPFEYLEGVRGKKIAFTTTNGTQTIEKAKGAPTLVVGAFLNLTAVADFLEQQPHPILIVCAGWKGRYSLEDTLFAGALIEKAQAFTTLDCDAGLSAFHLYREAKTDLVGYLEQSSHVRRLNRLNIYRDIEFCVTLDKYQTVPELRGNQLIPGN
jgi:2-phosphosulfolactate phosphatase